MRALFRTIQISRRRPLMTSPEKSVTQLLIEWRDGDETALDRLIPIVYDEMRRLARYYMRRERREHTLQTTALINEAYIRLVDHKGMRWQNRAHFYAVAAQAMRRVLVDHARSRQYIKRGRGASTVELDQAAVVAQEQAAEIVALDEALTGLAAIDPRQSKIVELRYFGGMSVDETAEVLGISGVTVMRDWRAAKAWLLRAITPEHTGDERLIDTGTRSRLKR